MTHREVAMFKMSPAGALSRSRWVALNLFPLMLGVVLSLAAGANAADDDGWTPEVFDYDRPARLAVEDKGEPADAVADMRQSELVFRNLRDEEVPVLLTLPVKGRGPFPAVLLVHGLGGDRRHITHALAEPLTSKGFACVALDLPMHGDRPGDAEDLFDAQSPERTYKRIVGAIQDIRQAFDLIKEHPSLDSAKGVPVVGYSLGAWFGTIAGAADRRVSVLVLQSAGTGITPTETGPKGDTEGTKQRKSEQDVLHRYPTLRPEIAIDHVGPRPLLMQNGRKDPFISEEHARNLYRHADSPKELRWYDAGHILPPKSGKDAADWIERRLDR